MKELWFIRKLNKEEQEEQHCELCRKTTNATMLVVDEDEYLMSVCDKHKKQIR